MANFPAGMMNIQQAIRRMGNAGGTQSDADMNRRAMGFEFCTRKSQAKMKVKRRLAYGTKGSCIQADFEGTE